MRREWRKRKTLSGIFPVWTRFCQGESGFATGSGSDGRGHLAIRVFIAAATAVAATAVCWKADKLSFIIPRGWHFRRMGGPLPRGKPGKAGEAREYIPETNS